VNEPAIFSISTTPFVIAPARHKYILNICMLLDWRQHICRTRDGFRMTNNFVYGRPGLHSHGGPMLM
jgi:hypothetical protein